MTQIIATPLAWTIKPVVRAIHTGIKTLLRGGIYVEDNAGMQRLLKLAATENASDELLRDLVWEIHSKYKKAVQKGQATRVDRQQEGQLFESSNEYKYYDKRGPQLDYLRFFTTATNQKESTSFNSTTPQNN